MKFQLHKKGQQFQGTIFLGIGAVIALIVLGITLVISQEIFASFEDQFDDTILTQSNLSNGITLNDGANVSLQHFLNVNCVSVQNESTVLDVSNFTCFSTGQITLNNDSVGVDGLTWNVTYTYTDRTFAFNASQDSITGIDKVSGFNPTIGIIIGAVLVIMLVFSAFLTDRFRFT